MRKSITFNKTTTSEHSIVQTENFEAKPLTPETPKTEQANLEQKAVVGEASAAVPNIEEEPQTYIAENLSEVKVSRHVLRRRKKQLRKKRRKARRIKRKKRRLRKRNVSFLSKYNIYRYFLPKKPLLLGAKKKEVRRRIKKSWMHKITIKVSSNNIFCTLVDRSLSDGRVLLTTSAGQSKIKITKKRLKRQHKPFLKRFFAKVWPLLGLGGIMIFITAPIRLRKKIMSLVLKLRTYRLKSKKKRGRRAIFIKVWRKKCFNGCQSSKRRRKKRKGIRLTK